MVFDVAVVGASVCGSSVAALARQSGLSVALFEARRRGELGRTVSACTVPVSTLEAARLPVGEVLAARRRIHLAAGDARVTIDLPDCVIVEPGALSASLLDRAVRDGAAFFEGAAVLGLDGDGIATTAGRVRARFVVDASGTPGAALLGELAVAPHAMASVAHETHAVADASAMRAALEALGAEPGEAIVHLAPCGPGSIVVLCAGDEHVTLEAITLATDRCGPTARSAIRRFVSSRPWIGEARSCEAWHVPVASGRDSIVAEHVALVGSATGLTLPVPGLDLAFGMLSARLLADALVSDGDLAGYDRLFRARFGKLAATSAALLRAARTLDEGDLGTLVRCGVIGERLVSAVLELRSPRLASVRLAGARALQLGRRALARALPNEQPDLLLATAGGRV